MLSATLLVTLCQGAEPAPVRGQPLAYVASPGTGVFVVDITNDAMVDMVPIEETELRAVAVSADGQQVYASGNNKIFIIDAATKTVTATVTSQPEWPEGKTNVIYGIAGSPTGGLVYAANSGDLTLLGNTLSVIDVAARATRTAIEVGQSPLGVAVNQAGTRAYVTGGELRAGRPGMLASVSVVDTSTNTVAATVRLCALVDCGGGGVEASQSRVVVVSPDSRRIYVASQDPFVMYVSSIDATSYSQSELWRCSTPSECASTPSGLAVGRDGALLYLSTVADGPPRSANVLVISVASHAVVATVPIGGTFPGARGIAISPDGSRLYVTNSGDDSISVVDTTMNRVVGSVALGAASWDIAIGPTPTTTPTGTPTNSSTATTSPTPTVTRTATVTPTVTLTATRSFTSTYTVTRTATRTATRTLTGTNTPTATTTRTQTRTATVTLSPTPTSTPRVVHIDIGSAGGAPGESVSVTVSLLSSGVGVAATGNDIAVFDPEVLTLDIETCHVNPAIGKSLIKSAVSANVARFFVQSGENTNPIPDGPLYSCTIRIAPSALPGTYTLFRVNQLLAFSPTGAQIQPVVGANGSIVVSLVPRACPGDCDRRGSVTIDELVKGINIALGIARLEDCSASDSSNDGKVTVDELVKAVNAALKGCGTPPAGI